MPPEHAAQPAPEPPVEFFKVPHVRSQPEVVGPAPQDGVEFLDGAAQGTASPLSEYFAHPGHQPPEPLRRYSYAGITPDNCDRVSQKLAFPGARYRTLLRVNSELQTVL
ncbi:hypothetical protein D3C78_1437960 [compost metagenome]